MRTSCQFQEHSEGRNSHNIAHNLSGAVAKWFYLWNWHALFVLDNAIEEFKGLKEIFWKKWFIFGAVIVTKIYPLPKG